VRTFLWKCTHNAYKIGNFWDKIPEHEHYSLCPVCKVEESMEHILLQCTIPGQQVIWNLARQLWDLKKKRWPRISYGTILGCSLTKMTDNVYKKETTGFSTFWYLNHPTLSGSSDVKDI
jgi:hypothetical protein